MKMYDIDPLRSERGWYYWELHVPSSARSAHDRVILDVVEPVVTAAKPRSFFFLRYWQGGPHIRLRMRDLSPDAARQAESMLRELFGLAIRLRADEAPIDPDAYGLHAASLAGAGEGGRTLPVEPLRAPGIYRAYYEPEYERYGTGDLMELSERLFERSSRTTLSILRESPGLWERALLAASSLATVILDLDNPDLARAFCARGTLFWRHYCTSMGFPEKVIAQVLRSGEQNGRRLAKHPEELYARAQYGPVTSWVDAIREAVPIWRRALPVPGGVATAPSLLSSHVHMLHNRLGLIAHEEMFSYVSLGTMLDETAGADGIAA